jgi:non-specific serine/threonine protein kinase
LSDAHAHELLLRLPGADGGPVGSPWLDGESPDLVLEGWGVPQDLPLWSAAGLVLDWPDVSTLLSTMVAAAGDPVDPSTADPAGIALATDLRFAALAADMVLELMTRGRVLPALDFAAGRWRAQWRPLIDKNDRGRIEGLLWALPLSFCAVDARPEGQGRPQSEPELETPDEALRAFMWRLTDAMVRQCAPDQPRGDRPRRTRTPGAVDAWLAALVSSDGTVEADGAQLTVLTEQLRAWQASAGPLSEPVRTCFRIVSPVDDGEDPAEAGARPEHADQWRIEFALQAVDDPSLLVSAATVWSDGPELTALERHVAHPDESLLRGLGRAARLVPSLIPALSEMTPCDQVTDATGILDFLRNGAQILEEAGFGVQAPSWWHSPRSRLGLRLRARTSSKTTGSTGTIGLEGICDVRWEAVLGDEKLGISELRQLARLKQPLVRMRGQWVELHEGDLDAAIKAVERRGASADRMTAGAVLRTALGLELARGDLPVVAVDADGWLGDLLAGADDRRLGAIPTPDGFAGALRPYQERGLGWLVFLGDLGLGACLADDMGLGKTAQLLALLLDERARAAKGRAKRRSITRAVGPTLVLCPMSVLGNWQREAARFAPNLSVYVHHGSDRLDGKAFVRRAATVDLVLSTYGLAVRDQQLLAQVSWRRVALDEAQQIKNTSARTTQSVRAIPSEQRVAMTGTPVENRLSELWSIMQFLNPGMLGSEKVFRERFAIPIERDRDEEVAARLRRITGPFVLRRLKTDRSVITDLPDKMEMKEFCTLTREQATLYQAVVDDMLARIDAAEGIERRGLVLAAMTKLKQVCNHPAHFLADGSTIPGRSGKLTRLVEVLEEAAAEGDRSLVFTQFTQMGDILERHLRKRLGCDILWLHGRVSKKVRDAMVGQFQDAPGSAVFLLSLKAGGTGLNLTAATNVVHYDRWWNPAVEDQATDRAFRIGQKRNVQVRKFVCGGTLEERIDALIEAKRALADRIVGSGEGWITELSTEQLREIVALSADAVGED